jgi:hypothetical protein
MSGSEQELQATEEIREWLEWSGSKLLSLRSPSPGPKSFRSAWPDFPQSSFTAYGYTAERLRPPVPTSREIALMDEILLLPALVSDPLYRRIIHARSLVTPIVPRYLYSWAKLARLLHLDRRTVSNFYLKGMKEIDRKLERSKRHIIQQTFLSLTS